MVILLILVAICIFYSILWKIKKWDISDNWGAFFVGCWIYIICILVLIGYPIEYYETKTWIAGYQSIQRDASRMGEKIHDAAFRLKVAEYNAKLARIQYAKKNYIIGSFFPNEIMQLKEIEIK